MLLTNTNIIRNTWQQIGRWAKNGGDPKIYATLEEWRADEPNYEKNAAVISNDPKPGLETPVHNLRDIWFDSQKDLSRPGEAMTIRTRGIATTVTSTA